MDSKRRHEIDAWYIMGVALALMLVQAWWTEWRQIEATPFSAFEHELDAGNVTDATVTATRIEGTLEAPKDGATRFVTNRVDLDIADKLAARGGTVTGASDSTIFTELLSWLLPVAVMIGFWWVVVRRLAKWQGIGGLTTIGKSRTKVHVETDTRAAVKDVVRLTEPVRRFDFDTYICRLIHVCHLSELWKTATEGSMKVLDDLALADISANRGQLLDRITPLNKEIAAPKRSSLTQRGRRSLEASA